MIKFCWAISTYGKNEALRELLKSFSNHLNPDYTSHIVITDDKKPEAECVLKEFPNLPMYYVGGDRVGIGRNKNRGIKFFLEETNDDYLVLCDDDFLIIRDGLEDELMSCKHPHVTLYLGTAGIENGVAQIVDENHNIVNISASPFLEQFSPEAENAKLFWCKGSLGLCNFFTREVIEKVKFFNLLPGKYGMEHSLYSARINRLLGRTPEFFPVLKSSPLYIKTQEIPNTYFDHEEGVKLNSAVYPGLMEEVYQGKNLINRNHGLKV